MRIIAGHPKAVRRNRPTGAAFFTTLLLGVLLSIPAARSHEEARVHKLGSGLITFSGMIAELIDQRVVFVGEKHNDPWHHQTQLHVISSLHQNSVPLAIGLEMFTARDQRFLDAWVGGKISEQEFVRVFQQNWGFAWPLYRDIFLYARQERIPLFGLNVPRSITQKVAAKGVQALSDRELDDLPPNISCDLDARYKKFIRRLFHFKESSERTFNNFCEAQVVWDQAMAWHLADYLKRYPDRRVVVLAGAVHAWKYGIARQLQKYADVTSVVILPDLPADYRDISQQDADYFLLPSAF